LELFPQLDTPQKGKGKLCWSIRTEGGRGGDEYISKRGRCPCQVNTCQRKGDGICPGIDAVRRGHYLGLKKNTRGPKESEQIRCDLSPQLSGPGTAIPIKTVTMFIQGKRGKKKGRSIGKTSPKKGEEKNGTSFKESVTKFGENMYKEEGAKKRYSREG